MNAEIDTYLLSLNFSIRELKLCRPIYNTVLARIMYCVMYASNAQNNRGVFIVKEVLKVSSKNCDRLRINWEGYIYFLQSYVFAYPDLTSKLHN